MIMVNENNSAKTVEDMRDISGRNGMPGGVLLLFPWLILLLFSQLIWKVEPKRVPSLAPAVIPTDQLNPDARI